MIVKNFISSVLIFSVCTNIMAGCGKDNADTNTSDNQKPAAPTSDLYVENTDGYRQFRIPAVVLSQKGTLLAFAEGRKFSGSDTGDIDLVLKRSTDGGKTWSKMQIIWDDNGNTCGNPSPVVDPATGRIHLLMTWNDGDDTIGEINQGTSKDTRRVYHTFSDDDGISWSDPEEITSQVKHEDWGWYATGPCHGMVVSSGKYKGRILIPCDCIEVGPGRQQYSFVIWSDDNGQSWQFGGTVKGGNECTVAETSDGRLILNMRNSGTFRTIAYSEDGGETWSESSPNRDLIDPVCQGSMLNTSVDGKHVLYFSNSASSTRDHMTVKKSTDDGANWDNWSSLIYEGKSAYSDIVSLNDDELFILYENGTANSYQKISFKTLKK